MNLVFSGVSRFQKIWLLKSVILKLKIYVVMAMDYIIVNRFQNVKLISQFCSYYYYILWIRFRPLTQGYISISCHQSAHPQLTCLHFSSADFWSLSASSALSMAFSLSSFSICIFFLMASIFPLFRFQGLWSKCLASSAGTLQMHRRRCLTGEPHKAEERREGERLGGCDEDAHCAPAGLSVTSTWPKLWRLP